MVPVLSMMQVSVRSEVAAGLSEAEAAEKPFIASMGIYVFRKDVLIKLLKSSFPKVLSSSSNSLGPDQATLS